MNKVIRQTDIPGHAMLFNLATAEGFDPKNLTNVIPWHALK